MYDEDKQIRKRYLVDAKTVSIFVRASNEEEALVYFKKHLDICDVTIKEVEEGTTVNE